MPEETGRIGKRILEEHDPYRLIGDRLFEKWREEEFADLYSREGKPGLLARDPGLCEYLSVHGKISRSASSASADRAWIGSMRCTCHWRMQGLILVY